MIVVRFVFPGVGGGRVIVASASPFGMYRVSESFPRLPMSTTRVSTESRK